MKKSLIIAGILLAINVAIAASVLIVLPDQIPTHFDASGEADGTGSKFAVLMLPAMALLFGIFLMLLAKLGEEGNGTTLAKANVGMQALFTFMDLLVCLYQLSYSESAGNPKPFLDMSQICALAIGATLIVAGGLMPKSTRNAVLGIRLSWTQKSDEAWSRSQRFGGRLSIAAGTLMVLAGFAFSGPMAFAALIVVFVAWAIGCLVGSYRICKGIG